MKILEIVSGQRVNGAMVHVNLLSRKLVDRGHEVKLLHKPNSWMKSALEQSGIECHESSLKRLPPAELLRIAKWVRSEKFDVIHTHMSGAHFFGVLLKRLTGVPCVATAHSTKVQPHWCMNDLVIANSESTRTFQARFNRVSPKRMVTISFFIDDDNFSRTSTMVRDKVRQSFGVGRDQPLIGVVAAVLKRKGHRELIEAMPQLIERFPNQKIAFIGPFEKQDAYCRQLRKSLFRKGLFRRVVWTGSRNNVHELVQGLDACVVPSLKEPLGMCAVEAMTAGIPVAAANVGGLREFVRHEKTGLLFNPKSPKETANAITRILTDEGLRSRVIKNAKQLVVEKFSPEVIAGKIESALASTTKIGLISQDSVVPCV